MAERIDLLPTGASPLDHPALQAWSRLTAEPSRVGKVSMLKHRAKSTVYRIESFGQKASLVLAKYCRRTVAAHERIVYEEILPGLPIKCPRYYGFVQGDPYDWLFLEYVEGEMYSRQRQDHMVLGGRWLGLLHTLAQRIPAAARFPELAPAHYLDLLRRGHENLSRYLQQVTLPEPGLAAIEKALSLCDSLESHWNHVQRWCECMPRTLVHADFKPKNIVIRSVPDGLELVAFDWEHSRWGILAEDLAYIDLAAYYAVVQHYWRDVTMQDLQFMKIVGMILRGIAEIYWESFKFSPQWEVSTAKIERYQIRMAAVMEELKLGA